MDVKMNAIESKYYSSSKILMELIGLWPYQDSARRFASAFIYIFLTSSLIAPQVLYLFTSDPEFDIYIENTVHSLFIHYSQIKYLVTFTTAAQFKILFSQIKKDWKMIEDEDELEILRSHSEEARLIAFGYSIFVYSAWVVYNGSPFIPFFLDTFFPLKNSSWPMFIPVWGDYVFFEQFDHYYWTCFHAFFVLFFVMTLYISTDTIYLCTVQHTTGMFAIVCYRLRNLEKHGYHKSGELVNLRSAVELFNDTIRCCHLLEDSFSVCAFIVLILGAFGISCVGFTIIRVHDDLYVLIRSLGLLMGILVQVLYLNWVGQKIIDSSEKVFNSVYFSDWYLFPTKTRKSILIIMCRTLKPHQLTGGKMIILSMQTFGSVLKSCTSIFAVLTYMDQKNK